jgi:alanine-glyoxylate transaminase/serine-glyoxylate transaminase/serine-pyruvate transaminase
MTRTSLPPISDIFLRSLPQLHLPTRFLFGEGPGSLHPRILQALSTPPIFPNDRYFQQIAEEIDDLLRYLWQTDSEFVLPWPDLGQNGLTALMAGLVAPGESVLVGMHGAQGEALAEMAQRQGARVLSLPESWGQALDLTELREMLHEFRPALCAITHGEISTGVLQPLNGLGEICRATGTLLLVDASATLGSVPVYADAWQIDAGYAVSHYGVGSVPGLGLLTLSPAAVEKLHSRGKGELDPSLDLLHCHATWQGQGCSRPSATPINLYYALREALLLLAQEQLAESWQRHMNNAQLFWMGLEELDLHCLAPVPIRLPTLSAVRVPEGIHAQRVIRYLRQHYNIEISPGVGKLQDQVWRISMWGHASRAESGILLLAALGHALRQSR